MGKSVFLLHWTSLLLFAESKVMARSAWQLSIHRISWHLSVWARVRVCAQELWTGMTGWPPHVTRESVQPSVTCHNTAAWSPGAPAWPGHWPARNNRDWQEGNEGSHEGREVGGGGTEGQGHMTGGLVEGWRQESEREDRQEKFTVVRSAVRIMMWEQVGQSRSKEEIKERDVRKVAAPGVLPS